jgi:SAM-dependent methyltransferase
MDLDDLVRDSLPVNEPYDGLVAEAYDVWLPPDGRYDDRDLYRDLIREGDGPALELGCGNGRLLVGYLADGLDVEGVDSSADMLAICRGHVEAAGRTVTLHHADWTSLALGRTYATLYNPAGSFSLLDDEDDARAALRAWRSHLSPGGRLVISMWTPAPEREGKTRPPWAWHVRRSATRAADGVTFMVQQAVRDDHTAQVVHSLDRHEVWDAAGTLRATYLRRHRIRWWTPDQLAELLRDCGYVGVEPVGSARDFLVHASAG